MMVSRISYLHTWLTNLGERPFDKSGKLIFEDTSTLEHCDSSKDKKLQIDFFDADTHIYDENMENTPFWKANDWNCSKGMVTKSWKK